jgi:hypothetical protein
MRSVYTSIAEGTWLKPSQLFACSRPQLVDAFYTGVIYGEQGETQGSNPGFKMF